MLKYNASPFIFFIQCHNILRWLFNKRNSELDYTNITVQHFTHYATKTPPNEV